MVGNWCYTGFQFFRPTPTAALNRDGADRENGVHGVSGYPVPDRKKGFCFNEQIYRAKELWVGIGSIFSDGDGMAAIRLGSFALAA